MGRTPVRPEQSVERRRSIIARATSVSTSDPLPAACERTRERWSCRLFSGSMNLVASAPNPVLTTLRYFRSEYEAHINNKRCPAHHCTKLLTYSINDACTGCMVCGRACKTGAITGKKKEKHVIDPSKCIQCDECYRHCKFDAVVKD